MGEAKKVFFPGIKQRNKGKWKTRKNLIFTFLSATNFPRTSFVVVAIQTTKVFFAIQTTKVC